MDATQITSTVTYFIVQKLKDEIEQGYINNVQTVDKNIWKIKIHKKKTKELIVTPNFCFVSENSFSVDSILGFEKYLKKKLYNQKIHGVFQDKNNKVICLKLDKFYLIFEFFSKSNVILTDIDFKIITSKQKEEWRDRTIKKGEQYIFPGGEDIKLKTEKEIIEELKDKDNKEIIGVLSKKYNVAPVEINDIINDKKDIVKSIFNKYKYKKPGLKFIKEKNTYILVNNNEDIFKVLENEFKTYYQEKEIIQENKKKDKITEILNSQEKSKEGFLEKIKTLEKEGEFIYTHFNLIDNINIQINKALENKILEKEIILKLNNYFQEKKIKLKIEKIDQKNKNYKLIDL